MGTIDIGMYFGTLALVASLCTIITGWLNVQLLKNATPTIKQIVSWTVAIGVCLIGDAFNVGIFADMVWWKTILNGLGVGLVSNGIFDIELVQAILAFIGAAKRPGIRKIN